jgi:hypothetical protein
MVKDQYNLVLSIIYQYSDDNKYDELVTEIVLNEWMESWLKIINDK